MTLHPLIGMSLIFAIFIALLVALRWYQRRSERRPEVVRKLMHVGMGLVTLSLPWLFAEAWPVLALAVLSIAVLIALRVIPRWRQTLGCVIGGVHRRSFGEIYFAASAAILFAGAQGDAILFYVPMLILTLADAASALIGLRYGALRFGAPGGEKSAEGSIAFFVVAFLSAHITLLLATGVSRVESLLIAATLALLLTLVEAMAWRGLDNLFIPLGGFVLLNSLLMMDAATLLKHLAVALLLVVTTVAVKWRRCPTNFSLSLTSQSARHESNDKLKFVGHFPERKR